MKQLIVAGDYDQFRQYVKEHGNPEEQAIYVSRLLVLLGRPREELKNIVFTGTWYKRKDSQGIIAHLEVLGIKFEHTEEVLKALREV